MADSVATVEDGGVVASLPHNVTLVSHEDMFPPGLRFGPKLSGHDLGKNILPDPPDGTRLYDDSGALRMVLCSNGDFKRYDGPKSRERLIEVKSFSNKTTCLMSAWGKHIIELKRTIEVNNGQWVCHYTNYRGDDRYCNVRCVHTSGREVYYEGPLHQHRLTMIISQGGAAYSYYKDEGTIFQLIKLRAWCPNLDGGKGAMVYYIDKPFNPLDGDPPTLRIEHSTGKVGYYEGPHHKERLARVILPGGNEFIMAGERGNEVKRRHLGEGGKMVTRYWGDERGQERRVRLDANTNPEYTMVSQMNGPKGSERLTNRITLFDATGDVEVRSYERGTDGANYLMRQVYTDGRVDFNGREPNDNGGWSTFTKVAVSPSGQIRVRQTRSDPLVVIEPDQPPTKRQRVKESAQELLSQVNDMTELGDINEKAYVAIADHLKALTDAANA